MTEFTVKTKYPKDESIDSTGREITTNKTEKREKVDESTVLSMYQGFLRQGYAVNVAFKTPDENKDSNQISDKTPFDIAKSLDENGIDYKATLKLPDGGAYPDMLQAIKLIAGSGYELSATIKIKENSKTTTDLARVDTWDSEDTQIKITPKATAKAEDFMTLKSLYDSLSDAGYMPDITIKPKITNADDPDEEFANQLKAYPDGTEVDFSLKDADLGGDKEEQVLYKLDF